MTYGGGIATKVSYLSIASAPECQVVDLNETWAQRGTVPGLTEGDVSSYLLPHPQSINNTSIRIFTTILPPCGIVLHLTTTIHSIITPSGCGHLTISIWSVKCSSLQNCIRVNSRVINITAYARRIPKDHILTRHGVGQSLPLPRE